jgi:glycosyltransferase involved in cell wall biosynthesis
MTPRIGFLISHPIQYLAPLFRELAQRCDLTVFFAHRQTAEQQAQAGFGVPFEWDIDLTSGYPSAFLVNVARRPSPGSFWGCDTPEIGRRIAEGKFDAFIVPGWALKAYWQAVLACRREDVPIFVRGDSQLAAERGGVQRLAKGLTFSHVLRRFDGFLYVGRRNREYLLHYGTDPARCFFSPHCVDNEGFRAGAERARRRGARSGLERGEARRLLFVGRLMPHKNPRDLLLAAALVRNAGSDVEVAFAGAGEQAADLQRLAAAMGVPAIFHGFANQTELPAIYAAADAIVLPSSRLETWGLVVNEAMACGLPAVVSDRVGCGPDLVEPGATGAVFPAGDVAKLAEAIQSVLDLEPRVVRRRVTEKIDGYGPAAAVSGILEGVGGLRSRLLQKRANQRKH